MREEPRSSRNLHLGSSVPPYIKPSGLTPPAGGAMAQLPLLQGEFLERLYNPLDCRLWYIGLEGVKHAFIVTG